MSSTPGADHGMREVECPVCQGRGETLVPHALVDPKTGEVTSIEHAEPCPICGGTKKVWL